jgi:uncharacterized membrane protein
MDRMLTGAPRGRLTAAQARPEHRGIGRRSSSAGERVSDDLRLGAGDFLAQRRRLAALTLGAMAGYAVVALYQFGLAGAVPEPRLPGLGARRVDASGEAYAAGHTPDAGLGLLSAAVTLVLAGTGDQHRPVARPWLPLALAGKVAADAAGSVLLFAEQITRHRRVCLWCTLAAALNLAAVPASWPEARAAWRAIRRRTHTGR